MRNVRELIYSDEFVEFYSAQSDKIKTKYDYIIQIMRTQYVVSSKFIKHLENTELYEARISLGSNEYRTILFTIDSENFMESKRILLLNSFMKKSTKQYKSEIAKAHSILQKYLEED